MTDIIDQLAEAVAAHLRPPIPLDIDLWDAATIAAYLKTTRRQVLERYAPHPSFPKAIRLPSTGSERGQPRWKAREVIEWAESFIEDASGRRRVKKAA